MFLHSFNQVLPVCICTSDGPVTISNPILAKPWHHSAPPSLQIHAPSTHCYSMSGVRIAWASCRDRCIHIFPHLAPTSWTLLGCIYAKWQSKQGRCHWRVNTCCLRAFIERNDAICFTCFHPTARYENVCVCRNPNNCSIGTFDVSHSRGCWDVTL